MSKYHKFLLLTIVLIIGAGIAVWQVPLRRGLDIAGGMRVVLQARDADLRDADGRPLPPDKKSEKMNAVIRTLRTRVEGSFGVAEPTVSRQGEDRVLVELPGIKDKQKALDNLKETARLEFYYLKDVQSDRNPSGKWRMYSQVDEKTGQDVFYFENTTTNETIKGDTAKGQEEILKQVIGSEKAFLTGDDLKPNAAGDLESGSVPVIRIEFNQKGADAFRDFTTRHVGEYTAIVLGGRIITAPVIKVPITDGKAIIERFPTLQDAEQRAQLLNSGALPVQLSVVQLDDVEATLGREVVNSALLAGLIGLILVLLFMLAVYRLPGLLADVALGVYALLTLAAFKLIGVTMTLPGLAAFILSIGMAVDANILIFERLKEELRSGKTLHAAIDAGFSRAFTAIFDSNMCTIITALILMKIGTGTVQSFAFTLVIGVLISMFTAITVTRTFLHLLVSMHWAQKPALFGISESWFTRSKLNIVGRRNVYFAISAAIIIPGVVFYFLNMAKFGSGLVPGIEFKPGTTMQLTFQSPKQAVEASDVQRVVEELGIQNNAQISKKGSAVTAFIRTGTLKQIDTDTRKISDTLQQEYGPAQVESSSVGPTISKELTRNAIIAILLSAIVIVFYLAFRFSLGGFVDGLKYGVTAITATLHDVVVITGLFAIAGHFLGWEIDTLFVTAVLTMIGFSTHDTIVVFDRIRENMKHRVRGEDFEGLANRSILQTFTRSINTSMTVLLTILALTIFGGGGPSIRHMYIALLIGIISGTYSSIFNATPLLVVWEGISSRRKGAAGQRRLADDKTFVTPRKVEPVATVASSDNGGDTASAGEGDRAKVKPKRKKRRY